MGLPFRGRGKHGLGGGFVFRILESRRTPGNSSESQAGVHPALRRGHGALARLSRRGFLRRNVISYAERQTIDHDDPDDR
ncbi:MULTISPECIES: hypothetical protein [Rhizobium]|uniref:Uncharacterized protein n=1 Tax=Rhizobium straminoryzae TaxID=1387186 RepID=A0A549TCP1_9HYPH|nr:MULTISPECIES: hypothetical protein [Rhizobium]TRL39695.1 hypothetical protein FNA46_08295 [Rhizobium straminoryzae]